MLQLSTATQYYWYNGVADMRKGFDSLCGMVSQYMGANVLDGGVFIFVNRRRNQIKLLTWEGDDLAIYHKRLEKGGYELPHLCVGNTCAQVDALQLQLILQGIVLQSVRKKRRFSLSF